MIVLTVHMLGPRTAQGLTKAALEAAQSAVNQRLSGGGGGSRSSGSGGKVSLSSNFPPLYYTILKPDDFTGYLRF